MSFAELQTVLELGLICSLTVLALFLSYSMLNVCDLSTDGCFTLGATMGAMVAAAGHPFLSLSAAMLAGVCSGFVVALLQTKLGINSLLAGIIVNTGLYSVNIAIMSGAARINLTKTPTVFSMVKSVLAGTPLAGWHITVVAGTAVILAVVLLTLFLNTRLGLAIRATGNNPDMVRSSSINPAFTTIVGLCVANALTGLSGCLMAQAQQSTEINIGSGMVTIALASPDRRHPAGPGRHLYPSCWDGAGGVPLPAGVRRGSAAGYARLHAQTGVRDHRGPGPGPALSEEPVAGHLPAALLQKGPGRKGGEVSHAGYLPHLQDLQSRHSERKKGDPRPFLHLDPGDFVTIIGSNGAGKSTLFNAICGDFLTDSGSIVVNGQDVTFMPSYKRSKHIGRLFQDPMRGSAPGMTIEENLALAAGSGGWFSHVGAREKKSFRDRLAQLDMGLEDRMRQPVGLLSGGQRQALTLLMSTMNPPWLLLLDEHTAALTPPRRRRCWRSPRTWWRSTPSPPSWSPTT